LVSFYDSALFTFKKNDKNEFEYKYKLTDDIRWFDEQGNAVSVSKEKDSLALLGAYDTALSHDGHQLFVASSASNALAIFTLGNSGQPKSNLVIRNQQNTNYALSSSVAVQISNDDSVVAVASYSEHAITLFNRTSQGKLSYKQTLRNSQNGIISMMFPHNLAFSSDSQYLYVAADGALTVFKRNKHNLFDPIQSMSNTSLDANSLGGAVDIKLTPDNRHLIVASETDNAIAIFSRGLDGLLNLQNTLRSESTMGISSININADGNYLYTTSGDGGDSLSVYRITYE